MAKSGPSRIGIFGGSFNPVHRGHMRLAQSALEELGLRKVYFVPTYQTPLKKSKDLLPLDLRLACLRAAIKGKNQFALSLSEIRRRGSSYTVDTLREFRRRLGPQATLYFLAGADAVKNFSRWKSPDEVIKLSRFVICTRPGYIPSVKEKGLLYLSMPALDISASKIRSRFSKRQSLTGLVLPAVEQVLKKYQRKVRENSSKPKRKSP